MNTLPTARVKPASNWSAVWVLPLIALAIGAWLVWRAYSQAGVQIQVVFHSGDGIEVNKTAVIYKGIAIGKVIDLNLDGAVGVNGVVATLEMDKAVEPYLLEGSQFWLVKPSVTLAGITGLDTLVSGNYITVQPGTGQPARRFVALPEAPPLADSAPGLHLTLKAERLGSLNRDSPVFYRQIQVGRVKSYALTADQRTIEIKVFIEPQYAQLVRKHTRFWNASGFTVEAGLGGVKLHSESLASVVAGGIAFATPEHRKDSPATDPALPFRLYDDYDSAQTGVKVQLHLSDFEGMQAGSTPVLYKGSQVGLLKTLQVDDDLRGARAELVMDPMIEDYLAEGTDFWVVKPSISMAGISGLEALVKGNYIAIRPGQKGAAPLREFVALNKAPAPDAGAPGLHLTLVSDNLGSLEVGSPVLYRQTRVGSVQSHQFSRDRQQVILAVHIQPEYADLVNSSSRFWNASGISLSGSLSGIQIKSESLQSLIAGGIAFETPDPRSALNRQLPRFRLHADRDAALRKGVEIEIALESGDGLRPGTPIRFKGLDLGKVESISLADNLEGVLVRARIIEAAERVARAGSEFWVVKPELGLTRTANLETLVSGQYIEVKPGRSNASRQTRFTALRKAPVQAEPREEGLRLTLSAPRRGSIKVGIPVTYREVKVGSVTGFELGPTADRVLIKVVIEPRYATLVRTGSRFWNASGFGVDFSLFKGAKIRTESVESLLEGGIAFATPEGAQMGSPAQPGQTFALFSEVRDEWLQWAPKIPLANN